MSRPKFLRRLDGVNPPYRLIEPDGELSEAGRRAVQAYRDGQRVSKRRLRQLHAQALEIDARFEFDRTTSMIEQAEDDAGWPRVDYRASEQEEHKHRQGTCGGWRKCRICYSQS